MVKLKKTEHKGTNKTYNLQNESMFILHKTTMFSYVELLIWMLVGVQYQRAGAAPWRGNLIQPNGSALGNRPS